jgi:alkaline phosphatase
MIEETLDFAGAVEAAEEWVAKHNSWNDTLVVITADHETGCLTGSGSDPEWKPLEPRGKGNVPGLEWHSGGHTNQLVPVYAKGAGAKGLAMAVTATDTVHGPYLDNSTLGQYLIELVSSKQEGEVQ